MRARIDISEVEARTKIRAKYLRAIENEEWDLLPGPVYVKSFLRTYGDFLGLDSRMLVDEFKRRYERPRATTSCGRSRRRGARARARRTRRGRRARAARGRRSSSCWSRRGGSCAVIGGRNGKLDRQRPDRTGQHNATHHRRRTAPARGPRRPALTPRRPPPVPKAATLTLAPTGTVCVCVENGTGTQLIHGRRSTARARRSRPRPRPSCC